MECILTSLVVELLQILKQLILSRDLLMIFEMIDHLPEIMRKALKVNLARDRCPPKVVV